MLSFVHRRRESNQFTFLLLKMLINITKRKPNRKTDMLVDVYMSGRITMGGKNVERKSFAKTHNEFF